MRSSILNTCIADRNPLNFSHSTLIGLPKRLKALISAAFGKERAQEIPSGFFRNLRADFKLPVRALPQHAGRPGHVPDPHRQPPFLFDPHPRLHVLAVKRRVGRKPFRRVFVGLGTSNEGMWVAGVVLIEERPLNKISKNSWNPSSLDFAPY